MLEDARRCSQNAKMQSMGQGLTNAQLCMHFGQKLIEICTIQSASKFCIFAKLKIFCWKYAKMMKIHGFSHLHISANFYPNCMINCAFESPWPILCIFAFCEHPRAFREHLRAFSIWAYQKCWEKCDFFTKDVFYEHARRCSQDVHGCSQNAKMQSMGQGLSNAQFIMQFG